MRQAAIDTPFLVLIAAVVAFLLWRIVSGWSGKAHSQDHLLSRWG